MLHTLRIQNYALIDDVEVQFAPGFNVLTGETGAGKSIIIHALNLVLGARASSDAVRSGTKQAKIDAIFHLSHQTPTLLNVLMENAIEFDDDELHITRIVSAEGRSRAYVCGSLVPAGTLSAIGDELIDLHGQHEHQSLLRPEKQREVLDTYASAIAQGEALRAGVGEWHNTQKQIAELESTDREQTRHLEFLKFELEEIENAGLEFGEEELLQSRRARITNAEAIIEATARIREYLSDSETSSPALDQLGMASRELESLSALDETYAPLLVALEDLRQQLSAQLSEIQQLADSTEYDPQELDSLNHRLNLIRDLKRKYGDTIETVLVYADEARSKIAVYENRDSSLETLREQESNLFAEAMKLAEKLSATRKKNARKLVPQVTALLHELGMDGAAFDIQFETEALTLSGIDEIEFMLMANPGEPPKALRQVASGGEISRIMLALKSVFAETDAIPTLIFDEIDTGVGGAIANQIGARLKALASNHQTICITHLPQIAAAADTHYHVSKSSSKTKTTTHVEAIEDSKRVEEVARLLDGAITPLSIDHAAALLKELAS
jgi:DNA repair protein RecN (Recombination protein N)